MALENYFYQEFNRRKFTILVVDDDPRFREIIKAYLLNEDYSVIEADNGEEAVICCNKKNIDLVILDVMMPEKDGYETCKDIKSLHKVGFLPVIMITALNDNEEKIKAFEAGADDFLNKPATRLELVVRVKSLLRIRMLSLEMENIENVLYSMVKILETRDPYTSGHSERVATWSGELASKLGLSEATRKEIVKGAILHDIGKIGISHSILNKKAPLTADEWLEIKRHPIIGEKICNPLKNLKNVLPFIRNHHEKLDGSGYPDGMKKDDIPTELRVVSMIDIYDALTSERPYRAAMSPKRALLIIEEEVKKGWWDEKVFFFLRKMFKN